MIKNFLHKQYIFYVYIQNQLLMITLNESCKKTADNRSNFKCILSAKTIGFKNIKSF